MKISDILKQQGIFAAEIKTRFKNKQIQLNGDIVTDIEVGDVDVLDAGDFVFDMIKKHGQPMFQFLQLNGLECSFETNIKNDITKILSTFSFLRTSKKEWFVLSKLTMRKLNDKYFDNCFISKTVDMSCEKAIVFLNDREYKERCHFLRPKYDLIISKASNLRPKWEKVGISKQIREVLLDLPFEDVFTCKTLDKIDELMKLKKENDTVELIKSLGIKV